MKPVLTVDAKATVHILHRQGIVAYLWMQDEVRSKRLRVRRVKSEENDAGLVTQPLSKAVIAKHCQTLGYVNMGEENGQCKVQGVAMFCDFGSIQMFVTGVRTVSTQNTAGDHVKESSQRSSNRSSSIKRTSSRRSTQCL